MICFVQKHYTIMKVRKGSHTEYVLLVLEKSVDGLARFADFMDKPHWYGKGYGWGTPIKKSGLSTAIKSLRQKGLVEFEDDQTDQILVKLTELGKDALGDLSVYEAEWDKKWRVVIFDVPETKRAVRDHLRRRLKDWGFRQWQRSVWVSKMNVTDKLRQLITKLEVDDFVAVIESSDPVLDKLLTRSLH